MKANHRVLLVCLSLSACGRAPNSESTASSDEREAGTERRSHATFVAFSNWGDTAQIDVGMTKEGSTCRILVPRVADETTRWRPFQTYWAIRDDASNATLGTEVRDTFFAGDAVRASEFEGVHGFAPLNSQYAHLLALEGIATSPDGSSVEARIGSPFDVRIRVQAQRDGAGCASRTIYCETSGACDGPEDFDDLTSILVKQNFLGYPTDVIYR